MRELVLQRSFLKKPFNGVIALFIIVALFEMILWTLNPSSRYTHYSSIVSYIVNWFLGVYAPEMITLYILFILINNYHKLFKIQKVQLQIKSILVYELTFLPLFLVAYFIFIPITLHIRFLLREFPSYQLVRYQDIYLPNLYKLDAYFLYLPFVVILGYLLLNISLVIDFVQRSKVDQEKLEALNAEISNISAPVPADSYLKVIEARGPNGETLLNVDECYLFETTGHDHNVEHANGRFRVSKPLTVLENELDPKIFFRGNRNYIINLNYLDSYAYWEKGKYILYSDVLPDKELLMPRARMQSFKAALAANRALATSSGVLTEGLSGNV